MMSCDLRHLVFEGVAPSRGGSGRRTLRRPVEAPREAALHPAIETLLSHAGLEPSCYRAGPLQRRLAACLRAFHVAAAEDLGCAAAANDAVRSLALNTLLLGVTQFFRDPAVFAVLGNQLEALARERGGVRVWSVGCADGAELYSVAILLEKLRFLSGSWLLGTDCRDNAVRAARTGRYDDVAVRGLSAGLLAEWFEPERQGWRLKRRYRQRVLFLCRNMFDEKPEQESWDVILWRNCAMYLTPAAAGGLWSRLAAALRGGGIFVTGKAERPPAELPLERIAPCVYRKRGGFDAAFRD